MDRTSLSSTRIRDGAVPSIFPAFSEVRERCPAKQSALNLVQQAERK